MRCVWMLLLLLPLVGAQDMDTVLDDPAGDVQITVLGEGQATMQEGIKDSADLRHLRILEGPDELDFRIGMGVLEGEQDLFIRDQVIAVWFAHGELTYSIQAFAVAGQQWGATLYLEDNATGTGYTPLESVSWTYHVDQQEFGTTIARDLLPDAQGAPLGPGRALENIHVATSAPYFVSTLSGVPLQLTGTGEQTVLLEDEMGDDEPGRYEMQLGLDRIGPVQLRSEEPYRFSNGEASTFVYWVSALNAADQKGVFSLSASQVPDGWAVDVPGGTFELAAGQDLTFPVVLRTQFAHAHGTTQAFLIEMKEQAGDGLGRIDLGIHYPEIAQPAGHHNTLNLWHAPVVVGALRDYPAPAHQVLWGNDGTEQVHMNTAFEDERAVSRPADFRFCGGGASVVDALVNAGTSSEMHCQFIDLQPGLRMGMDFQTDQEGLLSIEIDATEPMRNVRLYGGLVLRQPTWEETPTGGRTVYEEVLLAEIPETEAMELAMGESVALELPVVPTPESDYIPYQPGQGLRLDLRIVNDGTNDGVWLGMDLEPRLLPGGTLTLPLNEYHDQVETLPDLGGITWTAGDTDRKVNPGRTVVFQAVLQNAGPDDTFDVRLVGVNEGWATLGGPEKVKLARNETHAFTVIVTAPEDATRGDLADLVLEAAGRTDPTQRALLQLRATVDVDVEIPDEAHLATKSGPAKDSPGPALPVLALGLLALARRAKRS